MKLRLSSTFRSIRKNGNCLIKRRERKKLKEKENRENRSKEEKKNTRDRKLINFSIVYIQARQLTNETKETD